MKNDLMERYIYAATRRLPRKQREDVAMELRGLIEDMLQERCGDEQPQERDIRVVLTELGTPQELAARYTDEENKALIAQPYYSTYCYVLKIVLAATFFGLTVAHLLLFAMEPSAALTAFGGWLNSVWNGMFSAFSVVTLLFAYFQHRNIPLSDSFDLNALPAVPKKKQEISKWESLFGIGFCVFFVVMFLLMPDIFSVITFEDGKVYPIFDMAGIRSCWYLIVPFAVLGIVREVVQLLEGRYNTRVLAVSLITNGISAILAVCWLRGHEVLSAEYLGDLDRIFAGEPEIVFTIFSNFNVFFLGAILLVLVLDSMDVTFRTLRK